MIIFCSFFIINSINSAANTSEYYTFLFYDVVQRNNSKVNQFATLYFHEIFRFEYGTYWINLLLIQQQTLIGKIKRNFPTLREIFVPIEDRNIHFLYHRLSHIGN